MGHVMGHVKESNSVIWNHYEVQHCMAKSDEPYLRNHRCCPANHYPTTLNCGVSARRAARLPAGALLAQ